ncbi:response regulator [Telmatobacter bradus]|uniref:response regulator n=1 Tax=Telmatobacter bradus TaxID=474953 RepID=UPI003B43ABCD
MKVLLVDDDSLFLEGLRNILEDGEIEVVGTATNATDAIEQALRLLPEVVLMDVQMPGQSGIEATYFLKSKIPQMKIVMMTVSENDDFLFDAILAGASGYLLKENSGRSFVAALEEIAQGQTPLSPDLAGKILVEFARRERERNAGQSDDRATSPDEATLPLSSRQTEILRQVAQGMTYKKSPVSWV